MASSGGIPFPFKPLLLELNFDEAQVHRSRQMTGTLKFGKAVLLNRNKPANSRLSSQYASLFTDVGIIRAYIRQIKR
jgi:hypothetical protein